MKIPALACVLLGFFAAPTLTKAQEFDDFKGLQRVGILVEELKKETTDTGLTRESLHDEILVALKRDVPKLKVVDDKALLGVFRVYLNITSVHTATVWVAAHVQIALHRRVEIIGDDGTKYFTVATVWEDNAVLYDPVEQLPSRIRDYISQAMTEFAAEYYNENP